METKAETQTRSPFVANRYTLVVMAAKRAKQIKEGAPHMIDTDSTNCLTIALEEIAAGKVNYIEAPETDDDEGSINSIASMPRPEPSALQLLAESLDGTGSTADLDESDTDSDEDDTEIEADSENETGSSATEEE